MMRKVIQWSFVFGVLCVLVVACGESATQKRANENARLSEYVRDSNFIVVSTYPEDSVWVDSATGRDIYYQTRSGLLFHEIEKGVGKSPIYGGNGAVGAYSTIRYQLYTLDSAQSIQDNLLTSPFSFYVGSSSVIKGMSEATYMMKEGGTCSAIMPSIIAYNTTGSPDGMIAPYQTIRYTIYLLDVR